MALVRKPTLNKLLAVDKLMKNDIGEQTSKGYPNNDKDNNGDIDWEDSYDLSNQIFGEWTAGNFGEHWGDVTNDGKYANIISIKNPLDVKNISTYDDFGTMYWFGDSWKNRKGNEVKKFDEPDDEMEKMQKKFTINEDVDSNVNKDLLNTVSFIKKFTTFVNEKSTLVNGYEKTIIDYDILTLLNKLSAKDILNMTIKFELGDYGFQKAVDKGLLEDISPNYLLIGAIKSGSLQYVKYALENAANVNTTDEHGNSPIIIASYKGYLEIVKMLIKKGANINSKDKYGRTPLIHAALFSQFDIVRYLVDHNADIKVKDDFGKDALISAFDSEIKQFLKYRLEKHGK